MTADSLRTLARHLDVPERTLRRSANEGLIHGERTSPRRFTTSFREQDYLRQHWPLLSSLRAALRTEPNVRLGVLFGSQATGRATPQSDIDMLVVLGDDSPSKVAGLTARLEQRLGRDVQVVLFGDAISVPTLMVDALQVGRVLVDRDHAWQSLRDELAEWREKAASDGSAEFDDLPPLI